MPKPVVSILASNQYGAYCIPFASRQRPVAQYILQGQVWEPRTVDFMRGHCGSGEVVTAGTYFGDFLPPLSAALAAGRKIWAFEPNPENYVCTEWTLHLNRLPNVALFAMGLSDRAGEVELCMTGGGGKPLGGASFVVGDGSQLRDKEQLVKIQVVTLDSVLPEDTDVSILQFDLEQHEQQALTGALKTIARCRPILILESLPDPDWLQQHIMPLGYKLYGKLHHNSVFSVRPVTLSATP